MTYTTPTGKVNAIYKEHKIYKSFIPSSHQYLVIINDIVCSSDTLHNIKELIDDNLKG